MHSLILFLITYNGTKLEIFALPTAKCYTLCYTFLQINSTKQCDDDSTRHKYCKDGIDISSLLAKFSHTAGLDKFCLAQLFTDRGFSEGTVGLAYIGKIG